MKKNKHLFKHIYLLGFLLSLISCQNQFPNFLVSDETGIQGKGIVSIRGSVTNYKEVFSDTLVRSSSPSARIITPEVQAQDYAFYLFGQTGYDTQKIAIGPEKINNISGTSGEFEIELPYGMWYLTMVAVHDNPSTDLSTIEKIKENALLCGKTICDYRTTVSPLSFTLSPDNLTKKGNINLDIFLEKWDFSEETDFSNFLDNYSSYGAIYNRNTGDIIADSLKNLDFLKIEDEYKANYSPSIDFSPQEYYFQLSFIDNNDSSKQFIWSDTLRIFPGRTTKTNIYIPELLYKKPQKPSGISFDIKEEDKTTLFNESDFFKCSFAWTNETTSLASGYILTLTDENGTEYEFNKNSKFNNIRFISGGLDNRSTSVKLWLEIGHEYTVALKAENASGQSDLLISENKIRFHRIIYNLQNGRVQNDFFGTDTTGKTGLFCEYSSIDGSYELKLPSENDLTSEGKSFEKWTTDHEGTSFQQESYDGYSNIYLYANYKTNLKHPLIPGQTGNDGTNDYSITIRYGSSGYNSSTTLNNGESTITIQKGLPLYLYVGTTGFSYYSVDMKVEWQESPIHLPNYIADGINCKEAIISANSIPTPGTYKLIIQGTDIINGIEEISQFELTLIVTD